MTPIAGYAEVIGDPIAHSRSPPIHNHWLEAAGLQFDYRATRVTRVELPDFLAQRQADPLWRGCNVTMPLKLDALMLAGSASDRAVAAGAANILLPAKGALLADNTDVDAILRLLAPRLTAKDRPDGVTLLGNGGAARAALVALCMLDVTDVRLQARDLAAADKLAVEFGLAHQPVRFDQAIATGGLINATPLGMAGYPAVELDLGQMPANGWVLDMVTDPAETRLLRRARDRGLAVIDGIAMLVEQAADSFMLLFGQHAPRQSRQALIKHLRELAPQ